MASALSPSAITAQQASQIALLDVIPDYLTGAGNTAITWSWVTQGRESVLRIWDMVALEQRAELIIAASNYYYASEDIALSPNGAFLAMIDPTNEHTIQVWDTRSGQQIAALEGHLAPVAKFTLSPDERLLASVERPSIRARDSAVKLWGLPTGDLVAQLPLDGSRVESLIFSPNGSWLGAATKDTKTHIWDMVSGTLRYTLPTYSDYLAFSPDGTVLLTVYQHTGRLWNLESGGMITEIDCPTPKTVLFSPDNTRLLMNYSGYSLQLWDAQTGASLGLYNAGTPIQAPDGRGWLALDLDGVLRLWDFADGAERAALPLTRRGELALSPDNRLLAVGVKLVDLATWTAYTLPHSTYPVPETVQDMAWRRTPMPRFSPDGTHLFVTGEVLMVYGLPDEAHPAWEPITARVIPTGIHLHDEPGKSPGVIGTVSGEIVVGGQALSLVYLPEAGGWVWPEYIDLRPYTLDDLPELWPD